MLIYSPASSPHAATRLLKPAALARRLRPPKLAAVARELKAVMCLGQAYGLMAAHFPDMLARVKPNAGDWEDALFAFLRRVENEGWFEIDWALIDDLEETRMQMDYNEDDEDEVGDDEMTYYLSCYLTGIPVKTYGWSEEQMLNLWDSLPWVAILAHILSDRGRLTELLDVDIIADADIWADLEEFDRGEAWFRLENEPYRFLDYGEPLCWLPEMANMACATTDNILLDNGYDFMDIDPDRWHWSSESDLKQLRAAYTEASEVVAHFEAFEAWMRTPDYPVKIKQMVQALMGANDDNA